MAYKQIVDFVMPLPILFGGAYACVKVAQELVMHYAPNRLIGPGGWLVDTELRKPERHSADEG